MTECVAGTPVTTSTAEGAERLDRAIESYLGSRADTPILVRQTLSDDPDHLMARCFMGYLTRLAGDPDNGRRSAELHRDLTERVAGGQGNAWERGHVAALGLWLADDVPALTAHLEGLMDDYPTDVLALKLLHYLYFYDGDAPAMRRSVAARLPGYRGHRVEPYVKGMLAFALEECADYQAAERAGREAVEANAADVWATHAVGHVMEMQGRAREGIAWMDHLRGQWRDVNNFRFHLVWHTALYHLAQNDVDAALALYDAEVGPAVADDFYLDMCNAASLLLRLEARGVDVRDRWQPLAAIAARHARDTELVFASLHYLMPLLRTGHPAAATLQATLEEWSGRDTTQGRVVRQVALDVAGFLAAVQAGDRETALTRAAAFRTRLHRIGGSHAQRELFAILEPRPPE